MAVVSKDLIWRLRSAEHASNKMYLKVWESAAGNPKRAEVLERPWGTIFLFASNPNNTVFNRAAGLQAGIFDHLDEIEAEFNTRDVRPVVEICAGDLNGDFKEEAMADLVNRGYRVHGVEGIFYGETDRQYAQSSKEVDVQRVETEEQMNTFLKVYAQGWGTPQETAQIWQGVGARTLDDPKFSAWLAYLNGEPAGCAQLYIHEGIGYFADACVLQDFRRRGCQRALFNARLEEARVKGAELIFSIAEFADQSANNMEAFGLRMATELWHWRREDSKESP